MAASAVACCVTITACAKLRTTYSNVATEFTVRLLLHADVHQSILPKHALGVEIGSDESAVPIKRRPGVEVSHEARNKIYDAHWCKFHSKIAKFEHRLVLDTSCLLS